MRLLREAHRERERGRNTPLDDRLKCSRFAWNVLRERKSAPLKWQSRKRCDCLWDVFGCVCACAICAPPARARTIDSYFFVAHFSRAQWNAGNERASERREKVNWPVIHFIETTTRNLWLHSRTTRNKRCENKTENFNEQFSVIFFSVVPVFSLLFLNFELWMHT